MFKSESIAELSKSLCKAQAEMSNPKKNASNPFFKTTYSTLSEIIDVSKPVLASHGLSVIQLLSQENNQICVETILLHESGEFIGSTMQMPILKNDPQSIGSVCSYIRRYSWSAICGLGQADDDGNATSNVSQAKQEKPKPVKQEPPKKETDFLSEMNKAASREELIAIWQTIPKDERPKHKDSFHEKSNLFTNPESETV